MATLNIQKFPEWEKEQLRILCRNSDQTQGEMIAYLIRQAIGNNGGKDLVPTHNGKRSIQIGLRFTPEEAAHIARYTQREGFSQRTNWLVGVV